ncbi:hypothetical protein OIU74_001222 [Salix koriyanagi]|uniref:Peptidase A1 domain-containing protein n=1 Tax=Salix koriyanagi TaxID=2511006 RepID=A0A9Q0X1W5_9ROSI|nr:hypothetical protein OIU74_001222 [Salix koriyanagi]
MQKGFRVSLKHVDSGKNLTRFERIQHGVKRGRNRLQRLKAMALIASSSSEIESPVLPGNGEYLMKLAIGTPPETYSAILDTGSDLIWTQCKPCTQCFDQSTPIFDPKKSSSFSKLPCSSQLCDALPQSSCKDSCEYLYTYGDYSSTQGILASETLTFGKASVPNVAFGCGADNEGSGFSQGAGLVGLGRGPLSLESRWVALAYLSRNPPFSLQDDGSGGLIIDSGTTITYLEESAFNLVAKEFTSQIDLPVDSSGSTGLEVCFTLPSGSTKMEVPKLVFHFDGADLELPAENYMIGDSSMRVACLAMGSSSGMSIFGNVQQQNMVVLHDLEKETLSFLPAQCDLL